MRYAVNVEDTDVRRDELGMRIRNVQITIELART